MLKTEFYNPEAPFSVHPIDILYQIEGVDLWLIGIRLNFKFVTLQFDLITYF